jgi:hypothetical protein
MPDAARRRALADIQFASMVDADLTPSEDETAEEKLVQLETVQSAIGVSISPQQTRLTWPATPAAEKAAALDDSDGGALDDIIRLPSPWRAGPNSNFQQEPDHRAALRDSFARGHRRRTLSGSSTTDGLRKYILLFPQPSSPVFRTSTWPACRRAKRAKAGCLDEWPTELWRHCTARRQLFLDTGRLPRRPITSESVTASPPGHRTHSTAAILIRK